MTATEKDFTYLHPDSFGNTDHCAGCGRFIPRDENRMIAILGSVDGTEIIITRFCFGCPGLAR